MAELVDALASETSGAIHGSSSLLGHTKYTIIDIQLNVFFFRTIMIVFIEGYNYENRINISFKKHRTCL